MPASYIDQSTPEAAIRSLNDALTRGDVGAVEALVYPGDKSSADAIAGLRELVARGGVSYVSDLKIDVVANDGNVARARTSEHNRVVLKTGEPLLDEQTGNLYTLMKKGDRWYFIGLGQQVPPGWIYDARHTPAPQQGVP
jgi:hypothetical protein